MHRERSEKDICQIYTHKICDVFKAIGEGKNVIGKKNNRKYHAQQTLPQSVPAFQSLNACF